MKAAVTGVNGYIGRHLSRELESAGWELHPYSDVSERRCVVDVIFHLAALTRNDRSIQSPTKTMISNVLLSAVLFELARESGTKVVYTSSAVIYSPVRTPYQISKITVDELAQWYNDNGGDIRIVRLAEVYGPGMTKGPIAAWREQYRQRGVIDVWEGKQLKHYVYIDDAVKALRDIAGFGKGVFQIGSLAAYDISDLAKLLQVPYRIVPAPRKVANWVPFNPDTCCFEPVLPEQGMEIIRQKEFEK